MSDPIIRERVFLAASLAMVVLLAWAYLWSLAAGMGAMSTESMPEAMPSIWSYQETISLFIMWSIMMVAMMLPAAAPMILIFMSVQQRRSQAGRASHPTWIFVAGYLAVWTGFSLLATLAQWGMQQASVISSGMSVSHPALSAAILVLAGIFQWSPLKHACLSKCRSPLAFIMSHWRDGLLGALRMGFEHGAYCVGCCWLLMVLLFVAGVMNLLWVMAITAFIVLEKLVPKGELVARLSGLALIALGLGQFF